MTYTCVSAHVCVCYSIIQTKNPNLLEKEVGFGRRVRGSANAVNIRQYSTTDVKYVNEKRTLSFIESAHYFDLKLIIIDLVFVSERFAKQTRLYEFCIRLVRELMEGR